MQINLNNYNYSYANAIGNALKQPLFKLVSNIAIASNGKPWESETWRVTKIAFHCLVTAVFILPAGLVWTIGKSISYLSKTQIDHESLYLMPPQIQLPKEVESNQSSIDIRSLICRFSQLNGADQKKDSLIRLCNWTANEDARVYEDDPSKRELFYRQLSIYLKGIIKKIESGELSKDKERDILMELAEASTRCYPTWLEASEKLLAEIYGQSETAEVKLLRLIQGYKESIILEFCQKDVDVQWHALNYVRNILGHELGLNTILNQHDPYAGHNDLIFSKGLTKWLFLQKYENVNRLISSIQTMINFQRYDASYHDFLVDIIKQLGIENSEDFVGEHLYNADYKLNEAGVNLMLRAIGIVK